MPFRHFAALLLVLFVFAACQQESSEAEEASHPRGNTFIAQIAAEPPSLHPVNSLTSSMAQQIGFFTTQRLTVINPETYKLAPVIAGDLPEVSEDGLTYSYRIHPDAAWDDGEPITSEDIAFSLKASCSPVTQEQALRGFFSVYIEELIFEKGDPKSFRLQMKTPYINNAYLVDDLPIMDKRFFDPNGVWDKYSIQDVLNADSKVGDDPDVQAWGNEFNDGKYGSDPDFLKGTTGPYIVEEWLPTQQIILKKREGYWGAKLDGKIFAQGPDRIIYKIVTEPATVELQLKQDEVDVALRLTTGLTQKLQDDSTFQEQFELVSFLRPSQLFVGYNMRPGSDKSQIFREKAVRLALGLTVPADEIIEEFYGGKVPRIASPVPIKSQEYNKNLNPLPFAPDSAQQLLEAAGWTDQDGDGKREKMINGKLVPLAAKLTYRGGSQLSEDIVQRIIYNANNVGFSIEADPVNSTVKPMMTHNFEMVLSAFSPSYLPFDFQQHWHTAGMESGSNYMNFGNVEIDAMIDASNEELDEAKRIEMVKTIQKKIYDEHPVTFICNLATNMALHKRINDRSAVDISPYVFLNSLED